MFVHANMKRGSLHVPYFSTRTMVGTRAARISAGIHAGTTGIFHCYHEVAHELTRQGMYK